MTTLLTRDQVPSSDTWDLTPLYGSDAEWELALKELQSLIPEFARFRGTLGEVSALAECLAFDSRVDQICERLGIYSYLKTTEDVAQSTYQDMQGRLSKVLVRASEEASYIRPEIMAIDGEQMNQMLADDLLVPYRLLIERMRRYKPHTLSEKEEQILAMQGEVSAAPGKIFRQLLDADMKFGHVKNEEGQPIELTNATLMQLLISPKRSVRKKAFQQYYQQFVGHENTLAATLASSVQKDVFHARVRKYASALDAALFADDVPRSVYDNLITAVHNKLPALYRYYDIRRRKMKLKEIHHYDTYVPILSDIKTNYTWSQAVDTTLESLRPLGDEYCQVLADGLHGRWCDRYPNKGKQSGAFSYGVYCAHPYIMMNYKPEVLDDMFTLTHEAGHAMHSYYSARQQPFEYYNYVIFVAEVASTFNEQLLSHHLMKDAQDDQHRAYLINRDIDAIRGTIIRQTMFAEYEKLIHEMAEAGEALTAQSLKSTYRGLLQKYFGPDFALDNELSLEGLRIPHFYRAFYVYKYATGLSAAIALSRGVLEGGNDALQRYLGFLHAGCSKMPLDILRDAGVDMSTPTPVETALDHFESLVEQLAQAL